MIVDNILTVDVEDWFHICGVEDRIPQTDLLQLESRVANNTLKILDILYRKGVKATFFVLGFVAEKHPDLIRQIQNADHEIATHGYSHHQVYTMTPSTFRQDLKQSVEIISRITSCTVKGFRAPEWSIRDDSLWALDILQKEGFVYDSSMAPLHIIGNPKYRTTPYVLNLNQGPLWEVPPLVGATPWINFPLGGGWGLRTFPYRLIRTAIQTLNNQGQPALIFLHPREFDGNNPHLPLPLIKRFVVEAGLETTEKRLDRLLNDFKFTTVSDVLTHIVRGAINTPSFAP